MQSPAGGAWPTYVSASRPRHKSGGKAGHLLSRVSFVYPFHIYDVQSFRRWRAKSDVATRRSPARLPGPFVCP